MATSNPKSIPSQKKASSGSKEVSGTNNTLMTSGFLNTALAANTNTGHSKSNQIQVIFNGKILTPQSLIARKYKGAPDNTKKFSKGPNKSHIQTIDESAPLADKVANLKQSTAATLSKKQSEVASASMKMGPRAMAKSGIGALAAPALVEETVEVTISETATLMHLSIPSLIVASDTRDVMAVDERNARYDAVVSAHKNADAFNSRPTQTKNLPLKNQNEMAAPNAFRDFASQAISFEILDATSNSGSAAGRNNADEISGKAATHSTGTGTGTDTEELDPAGLSIAVRKFVTETVGVSLVTPGCLLDTTTVVKAGYNDAQDKSGKSGTSVAKGSKKGKQMSGEQENSGNNSDNNVQKGGGSSNSGFLFSAKSGAGAGAIGSNHGSAHNQNASGAGGFEAAAGGTATGHIHSGSKANFSNTDIGAPDGSQTSDVAFTEEDSLQIIREAEIKRILSSPLLLKRLQLVERAVQQNANHRAQLDYRDLPDIAPLSLISNMALNQDKGTRGKGDAISSLGFAGKGLAALGSNMQLKGKGASMLGESLGSKSALTSPHPGTAHSQQQSRHGKKPSTSMSMNNANGALSDAGILDGEEGFIQAEKVRKLFSFSNPALVQNRSVTAMAWNTASSDLLAVGYGKTEVFSDAYKPGEKLDEGKLGGLVLFWSLRNPDYPEKILRTPQPVTALDFSKLNPMTLAVGLNNGDINIYNVKREGDKFEVPVESSAGMDNCHSDPVWQVKWIMKGVERIETLVSISSDGSILEWNMKKGLVMSTLMQLKKSGTGDGWISNSAAGLCFDFHPADPSTYVTGTEDGSIHRCSVSYNEQYLDTYAHHEGPTYRLRFSPRWPEVFMSCSADWSMNLYHFKSRQPLLSLRATGEDFPINDVAWCPGNSTVFGCVTMDSKLQLWDLSVSAIDPIVSIDTTIETEVGDSAGTGGEDGKDKNLESPPTSAPAANATGTLFQTTNRYGAGTDQVKDDDLLSPMNKLLKALNGDAKKKSLTCLLFGEKAPIVVVGDNRGTVSLYRIFNPVTITHQGPLQQMNKLKHAVALQTDPVSAAMIQQSSSSSSSSISQQQNGSELAGGTMM